MPGFITKILDFIGTVYSAVTDFLLRIMHYVLDPILHYVVIPVIHFFIPDYDVDVIYRTQNYLWDGMKFTLRLTLLSAVLGVILGTLIALMRLSGIKVLQTIAAAYVNFIRSLPLVLVIFWFYFLIPLIIKSITGEAVVIDALLSSLITFSLFQAAYYSEIMRAGIQSIPKGQVNAGYALGLTYTKVMALIVLPRAFRNMMPILLTQTIVLFQDTSLVYVVGLTDFLGAADKIAHRDSRLVEMYIFAAVIYFVISFITSNLVKRLEAVRT